ncbi:unnamed protein product [Ilex paraguariensis]|uniref:Uncharacterized protein n=1 Tax=Ilex paraguariensis TaxID=185542 RepID=A0ABC8QU54_9AQUA
MSESLLFEFKSAIEYEMERNITDNDVFGGLHLVSGLHIVRGPTDVVEDDGLKFVCGPTGAIGLHIVCGPTDVVEDDGLNFVRGLAGPTGVVEDSVFGLSGTLGVDCVANGDVSLFLLT